MAEKIAEELKSEKEEGLQTFSSKLKELVEIVEKTASWSKFLARLKERM